MTRKANYALLGLCGGALCGPLSAHASTVWTGPILNFVNAAGSDPTQPANQDRLTPAVWITRGSTDGIYNAATETSFAHFFSPSNTLWSDGALTNYASLSYVDWNTWAKFDHGGPPSTVGVPAVVHLISDDIYLSVMFTTWGGAGGGFSYVRSTPPVAPALILSISEVSSNQLLLSWPAAGVLLQAQTNGITTNWVNVAGSTTTNRIVIPIDPANGRVFYRLATP